MQRPGCALQRHIESGLVLDLEGELVTFTVDDVYRLSATATSYSNLRMRTVRRVGGRESRDGVDVQLSRQRGFEGRQFGSRLQLHLHSLAATREARAAKTEKAVKRILNRGRGQRTSG